MSCRLSISAVEKKFGKFTALEPTSLNVEDGEFITLLGPSGSGKTTLLLMIAGLLAPSGGAISIDGKVVTYEPPYKRDIGMVFQNYALFPHLTVFDNIAFPLRMRRKGDAEIAREVKRVLEIVQLPHLADRYPKQLSGGQQQRIALARCFVYRPSIILMDEPLGALDKKLRDQLQIEIKNLHKQMGTTIIYVSHDQQEALTMSDRVCLMNHGRIEQIGKPEQIYFYPETHFAADFLGESNIIAVDVVSDDGACFELQSKAFGRTRLRAAKRADGVEPTHVMVRPECVFLADGDSAFQNRMQGTVRQVIFTGSIVKYLVEIDGDDRMLLTAPTNPDRHQTNIGDTVTLAWSPDHTMLLPGSTIAKSA